MAPEIVNPASPSSIPLYLINGVATVWDAQGGSTYTGNWAFTVA